MKKIFCFSILALLIATLGCNNINNSNKQETTNKQENPRENSTCRKSFLNDTTKIPMDFYKKINIDSLSYPELQIMREFPYAVHGLWFTDTDISNFFVYRTKWYENSVNVLLENDYDNYYKKGFPCKKEDIKLSDEEKLFLEKIDKRITELEKERIMNNNLLDPTLCTNFIQFSGNESEFIHKLKENNFVIEASDIKQLFQIYEENDYKDIPSFITTDLFLQLYHQYFSYILKYIETHSIYTELGEITQTLYDESMLTAKNTSNEELKDLAEFNATFFAIAVRLIKNEKVSIPEKYKRIYQSEIENIKHETDNISPLLETKTNFGYSLFKPRGYYQRNETTEKYFRTMMWLQTAQFCLDRDEDIKRIAVMAKIIDNAPADVKEKYKNISNIISFLMGEPDNVSVYEVMNELKKTSITNNESVINPNIINSLKTKTEKMFEGRNRIKNHKETECINKINFIPQRYVPDNEILNTLTDTTPNAEKAFPKGLEVFAVFGSNCASQILDSLYKENTKWDSYSNKINKLKKDFKYYDKWNSTLYNKCFEMLNVIQNENKNYPHVMKAPSWQYKNLNTMLASWAELKHNSVLYAKQPVMAECGGGDNLPIPVTMGYVEPNVQFWEKLKQTIQLTRNKLIENGFLIKDLDNKGKAIEELVDFCLRISKKELNGEKLTYEEKQNIEKLGSSIEWITLSIMDPDQDIERWDDIQGPEKTMAVVSDVFTRNIRNDGKSGVLYEATGMANAIYVVVEIEGKSYLMKGATFGYYEFVRPNSQPRLTDKEWQEMLKKDQAPALPEWIAPFYLKTKHKIKSEETYLYSSGC